jgi:hypothetical protein
MKKLAFGLLAAATIASTLPAYAQGPRPSDWQPLSQRRDNIEQRIDQGVQNGQLTRREARGLHSQFNSLLRLESRYERDGLNFRERADLQHRFDALAQRVRFEKHDDQTRYHPAGR